ncbi:MAG: ferredoxin-NADP reductase [Bradymonadia bacterium]
MIISSTDALLGVELHPARVVHCTVETSWAARVVVDVSDCLDVFAYTTPGQFVALATAEGEARWFVISSVPADLPTVEFLIGGGTEVSDALTALAAGAPVRISVAQGLGYPMATLRGRPVTGFASGTGIASLRPVFDTLLVEGADATSLTVYYQDRVRDAGVCEHALTAELDAWRSAGVHVQCLNDTTGAGDVAAQKWRASPVTASAEHLICGNPVLDASVESALRAAGVDSSRVHRNY